jgi:hypothetical protein
MVIKVEITQEIIDIGLCPSEPRGCPIHYALQQMFPDANIAVGAFRCCIDDTFYALPYISQQVFEDNYRPFSFVISPNKR